MKGMSRLTGRAITDDGQLPEHLQQSLHDILSTLIGTRLARRRYGSLVPDLIDQPCNNITKLKIMNASATAIIRFEPRIKIKQVLVSSTTNVSEWVLTIWGSYMRSNNEKPFKQTYNLGATA